MAVRLSTGLRNYLLSGGDLRRALNGGQIKIYSGTQPASPDTAPSGTLLCTITNNSAAHTNEVIAQGSVTLTGGASGQVTQITAAGINLLRQPVLFNASLNQTASDVVTAINNYPNPLGISAVVSGAIIQLNAPRDSGANGNGIAVVTTVVTITKTDVNIGTGIAGVSSVNGLHLSLSAAGVFGILGSIPSQANYLAEVWSGVVSNAGTAGWFRHEGSVIDAEATDSVAAFLRLDGAVATSGAELNLTNTTLVLNATETVTSYQITEPAQ